MTHCNTSPSRSVTRNGSIEAFRILGAIGIIWFHLGMPAAWVGHAALHVFVALLIYFNRGRPLRDIVKRLMIPWAIWSVFYALAKCAQASLSGAPFATAMAEEFDLWMLLTGPALTLWFLPYSTAVLLLIFWLDPWLKRERQGLWVVGFCVIGIGAIWVANSFVLSIPWLQWVTVLPAVLLGLCLALNRGDAGWRNRCVALSLILLLMAHALGARTGLAETLLAVAALWTVLSLPRPTPDWLASLADLSLGVYLCHPMVIALLLAAQHKLDKTLLFVLTCLGALALTAALKKINPVLVGARA